MTFKITRNFTASFFASVLTVLVVVATPVRAQWTEVAPGVTPAPQQHVGALRFRDGVAWAGTNGLFISTDTGVTWNSVSSFQIDYSISDIAIYDSLHVLVSTYGAFGGDGLFLTTDGGQTWTNFFNGTSFSQVAFNGSPSVLHAVESITGGNPLTVFVTSLDGGATWNQANTTQNASTGSLCFAIAQDKTIYAQSYNEPEGWINISTDLGQTWSGNSNFTDGDCETLAVDSCNTMRLYFVNENVAQNQQTQNQQSKIDLSNDAGANWETPTKYDYTEDFYSGSLASTANVLYVGTVQGAGNGIGVERSTDTGTTWQNIGGPNEEFDTRTIAAVNDSTILVLDEFGNVWRTLNSGGFPIHIPSKFSASPATLFATDTISCDSITRTVSFASGGCTSVAVIGDSVIGANAASYKVISLTNDSALVTLYGVTEGDQDAQLVLSLDNGSTDTVYLAGYVNTAPSILSFVTEPNIHTDTLGGTISVPITIDGLDHPENVELVLNYTGTVQYLGSFSPTGVKLDVEGEQWPGHSELQIVGASSGIIAGYANFNVFNDSTPTATATFDSLTVLSPTTLCEYSLPTPVTSTMTTISGCGITMLSRLIYLGQTPTFSIEPNPTTGNVWISSSDDLGTATIAVYDMLGTLRSELVTNVQKENPIQLTLPDAGGVYTILLNTSAGMRSLRVVNQR
jgi:hypothetical protein